MWLRILTNRKDVLFPFMSRRGGREHVGYFNNLVSPGCLIRLLSSHSMIGSKEPFVSYCKLLLSDRNLTSPLC